MNEYGRIEGYDNHLLDIMDFDVTTQTTFWFKWYNGTEWVEVDPFTEWVVCFDEQSKNLKLLMGYNFPISGEIDIIVYANSIMEVYNGKLVV